MKNLKAAMQSNNFTGRDIIIYASEGRQWDAQLLKGEIDDYIVAF